jgi:pilus assembly protein CpaD
MQTFGLMIAGAGTLAARMRRAAIVAGCALMLCGCYTTQQVTGVPSVPTDYRMRHPIAIKEADHSLELFTGTNRGTLTPAQRADVVAFAQNWRREATGGAMIELPVGTSNERSAADMLREIRSLLVATGIPPQGIAVRSYHPSERKLATVKINYPKFMAAAGPCGIWPGDLGPSANRDYLENQPYYNLGCATQRNLAAMVDNPADLVQPRGETAPSAARRSIVLEHYKKGESTATVYPTDDSSKISDVGK